MNVAIWNEKMYKKIVSVEKLFKNQVIIAMQQLPRSYTQMNVIVLLVLKMTASHGNVGSSAIFLTRCDDIFLGSSTRKHRAQHVSLPCPKRAAQ